MSKTNRKASLKSRLGIILIVVGFFFPVLGLLVPLLDLSSALTTALVAFFMVGGPELFMVLGGFLAGKEGIVLVQNRMKKMLGLPQGKYAAPRSQYNLALVLMSIWLLSLILPYYVPQIEELLKLSTYEWYYFVIADVLFVVAFLFIGGDQLVTKLGKLFSWEPWELPPEMEKKL